MGWTVYNSDGQILQGSATLANDSVDSQHYVAASIDNEHLADDAVDSDELAAGAVDLAHMSVNSIDSDQYVDGSIDLAHMSSQSVDEDNLYISNAGSNGEFLSKQSGNNGGLTWAAAGGGSDISVQVHHNATQSISNTTNTILAFNTEDFDTDSMHDNSTNNNRLVATTAGKYLVVGKVEWQDSTTGSRFILIANQDGATQAVTGGKTTDTTAFTMGNIVTCLVDMDADDWVELRVFHNHGSALNALYPRSSFSMIKVLG